MKRSRFGGTCVARELDRIAELRGYTDTELPELNGYNALNAQDIYEKRHAIHRKMIVHPEIKAAIEDLLKAGWSPEQIAGRMRLERHPVRVSHDTIYRFAYPRRKLLRRQVSRASQWALCSPVGGHFRSPRR